MKTDLSFNRIKEFPALVWIIIFGTFLTRGSFFMVWPFLAVILYKKFGISATEVGLILTCASLISVIVSFIGSSLSDLVGRNRMMYATGVLYIISFALLAEADSIPSFVVIITLCSIASSLWRPLCSALVGDVIKDSSTRELAMQALYFSVNVGCAIGPIVGVWLGLTGEQSSFYLTTYAFLILLVMLFFGFRNQASLELANAQAAASLLELRGVDTELPLPNSYSTADKAYTGVNAVTNSQSNGKKSSEPDNKNPATSFKSTMKILVQDRLLQVLILANIICMFVYAQMDSTLIQYLTRESVPKLLELISMMIFVNAMIIISTQFLLLKLMSSIALTSRIQIGLGLLFVSQIWFSANPVTLFWGWIGATVILSLAEAILFPTMNVHIDRIAPDHLRGAYFGASSFYELGFALAPLGGGLLLDHYGGSVVFIVSAILTLVAMALYRIMDRLPRPA